MIYIILGIIIIGLLIWAAPIIAVVAVFVIAFLAFSWPGVFVLLIVCLVGGILLEAGKSIKPVLEKHDKEQRERAEILREAQQDETTRINDTALREELDKNCRWLGYMDNKMWRKKLPNYCDRQYSTDFDTMTKNFALQMEQQNITQNDEWFRPYLLYCIAHPQGTTATKMLNEVECPQLKATHATPDAKLLTIRLKKGAQRVSKDVPALFEEVPVAEMRESLFIPTKYALKLYGNGGSSNEPPYQEELDFDDL